MLRYATIMHSMAACIDNEQQVWIRRMMWTHTTIFYFVICFFFFWETPGHSSNVWGKKTKQKKTATALIQSE